jgi:hypothetical protein
MPFRADPRTLLELSQRHWAVPDFQREYVWRKKQVRTLLTDINSSLTETGGDYFLGVLVWFPDHEAGDSLRWLVDGQQRLATLFTLIAALRDRVEVLELQGHEEGAELHHDLQRFLRDNWIVSGRALGRRNRLTLQPGGLDQTLDEFRRGLGSSLALPRGQLGRRRLIDAYKLCADYVESLEDDLDSLRDFFYWITNSLVFVGVSADDIGTAYKVFETVNDRGKTLDAADLLKNLLFHRARGDRDLERSIEERWRAMDDALESAPETSKVRFLRYFVVANHDLEADRMVQASDLFEWIRQHPTEFGTNNPGRLCQRLADQASAYGRFLQGMDQQGRPDASLRGIAEQGSGVRQHLPILLAASRLQQTPFGRLAAALETLTLVLAATRQPWNQLESRLPRWCSVLRDIPANGVGQVDEFVAEEIVPWITGLRELFWRALDRTDTLRDALVRYLLTELERYIRKEARMRSEIPTDRTVEHIFPQQAGQPNNEEFFAHEELSQLMQDRLKEVTYSLGNLGLLTTNENSVADRHLYAEKRLDPYPLTDFRITRYLAVDMRMGVNPGINRVIERFGLNPVPEWNKAALRARLETMRQLVVSRWPLIPPPDSAGG